MLSWEDTEKMEKLHRDKKYVAVERTIADLHDLENWSKEIESKLPPQNFRLKKIGKSLIGLSCKVSVWYNVWHFTVRFLQNLTQISLRETS